TDQIAALDAAKARELIRAQSSDFAAYRSRLADGARDVRGAKAGQSASGAVGAQVDDKSAGAANQDQLKLSKSATAAAAGTAKAGASAAVGQNAAEQTVARDAALKESASRVKELEKNVSDLQKLLDLKNKQLADLQKQAEDAKAGGKAAAGVLAKPEAAKAAAVEPTRPEPVKADAPKAVEPVAQAPKADAPKLEGPKADAVKADAPKTEPAPVAAATEPAPRVEPAPAAKVEAPKAAVPAPAAPQASFADDLMSNPLMLPGLGAILALGAGYGWYAMRRRKKVEKFEDSLIAADGIAANSLFGSTGGQSVDTSSAFASATKDSGVDVHATEVDPIAEAEVYIAYGREAQAEEILREALRKQPERQAIRAKLLEIYSGRKDVTSYGALAAEMHGMTGGQNEEWPKVMTMGLAIDPTNALYSGREAEAPAGDLAAVAQPAPAELTEPPADALLDDVAEPFVPAAPKLAAVHSFAETVPMDPAEISAKDHDEHEIPALDFDLELDTTIGKAGEKLVSSRDPADDEARSDLARAVEGRFDLPDLDLDMDAPAKPTEKARANSFGEDEFNIDLPALEGISKISPADHGGGQAVAEKISADLDLSAIGLDLEPAGAPASTSAPDGVRWQEMATKLDLASAYEEIGDKEGARELLDEVVKGGDNDQQQKARAMLAKIA
ncbi:MAG TPA: FimV/HubP family polar landmark protein, partial [Burkholderiaceae bacterium]|nr:FimV/HubP family polar landmark protein [Burkholderiaceae bacterium]